MKWLTVLLASMVLFQCSPKTDQPESAGIDSATTTSASGFDENNFESYTNLNNYIVEEQNASEIQLIDSTCVVVINPTAEQIQKMEKEYGDDFATIVDDNSYYQSEAIMKFDSTNIRTVIATKRFLKFQGSKQAWVLDMRKDGAPEWNVILFNVDKKPELTSSIDATYEKIQEYFFR